MRRHVCTVLVIVLTLSTRYDNGKDTSVSPRKKSS
jgi:hypothetical protein